ncbi:acyl-CoA dehydrogenase family protein [Microbacterium amylolyticum]|uniref:Glutaryl-CoA dehydrogenase n=1 Tax=Microbacterium amylolyticum TaxID=936337 RepID=A0ABS4ZJF9_9MICO|nr:acyl-CoA dehydrogenase family protein [Microbacterium amylolyticum]MBP2437427.1 glutaryl-CoA dehydrogenase [Microbacterium amylolyticum]
MATETFPGERISSYDVTGPLDTDYYDVFSDVTGTDRDAWRRARHVVDEVADDLLDAWDHAEYPVRSVLDALGRHNVLADGIEHEGLPHLSPLAAGLVNMELSRGDGSLGTVLAVQGGLALRTLALYGSPEQKAAWLDKLHSGETPGAFALTEPDHGSDSTGLESVATRDGDSWVLRGAKKWIGNGASGGITFVWARIQDESDPDHGRVGCFLIPQETPGYRGDVIQGKVSLRAIHQAHILLDDVRVPLDARLPGAHSFADTSRVLYATRSGVAWSALGHATACYEIALQYAQQREQFGKPLVSFQLVQEKLTRMLSQLTGMQLFCRRLADLEASGSLRPPQASLAKYTNTRTARDIARDARDLLGGNGILLENRVMQHLADIEAIHTYEGTESVQALLIGRDITGVGAFV